MLTICGGLLGLLLASSGAAAIRTFGPAEIGASAEAHIDGMVILFTAAVTVFTALLASLWPAFESGKIRTGSRHWISSSTRRAGDLLVIGEFALALVLVASGPAGRQFPAFRAVELGFRRTIC